MAQECEVVTNHVMCTCRKCGRVHVGISAQEALDSVERFNEFYDSASEEVQVNYGSRASIDNYLSCFGCGGKQFRKSVEGDCPEGTTISPVIWEG